MSGEGNWTDASNWSNGVPFVSSPDRSLATIAGDGSIAKIGSGTQAGTYTLSIYDDAELRVQGYAASLDVDYSFMVGGTGAGSVLVTDEGSLTAVFLVVGYAGPGSLTIESKGVVNSTTTSIIGANGGTGTVIVDGGHWNTPSLQIGDGGTGVLTVRNGGIVDYHGSPSGISVGDALGGSGTLRLLGTDDDDRGTLIAPQVREGTGNGFVEFDGGVLRLSAHQASLFYGFEPGDITIGPGGAFIDTQYFAVATEAALQGPGGLTKLGPGSLTLSGASTYAGGTAVLEGTLHVNGGSITHASTPLVVQNATLWIRNGGIVESGGGNSGLLSATVIMGGTVFVDGGTWTQSGRMDVFDNSEMTISNGGHVDSSLVDVTLSTLTVEGGTLTAGGIEETVGHLVIRNGASVDANAVYLGRGSGPPGTVVGAVTVDGGSLTIENDLNFGGGSLTTEQVTLTVDNGGVLSARTVSSNHNGSIDAGNANIIRLRGTPGNRGKLVTGWINPLRTNSMVLEFDGGVLQLTYSNPEFLEPEFQPGTVIIEDGGAFIDTQNFAVGTAVVMGGTGGLTKLGTGTLTLSGANTYEGGTTVEAGTLMVEGSLASGATILSGAALGGSGTIAGSVTIEDNGTLSPGSSPGILTVGELVLNPAARLALELGDPGGTPGVDSDRVRVIADLNGSGSSGDLVLDGILDITDAGGFGPGTYRLIEYDGALTDNGLAMGNVFAGYNYTVNTTSTPGAVDLVVDFTGLRFWDGGDTAADGVVDGGNGTWDAATTNWTNENGNVNQSWDGLAAVFAGTAGTVEVNGTHAVTGLQFAADGYVLADANADGLLALDAGGTELRVNPGVTASIDVRLGGTGALDKTGAGTVTLSGHNTYTGGTVINAGTLSVSADANLGAASGDITFNAGTLAVTDSFTSARNVTLNGNGTFDVAGSKTLALGGTLQGPGQLVKNGAGTLALSGSNTYTGGTVINAGTLSVTGTLASPVTVNAGGTLAGTGKVGSVAVQGGTIAPGNSVGTLAVTGDLDFRNGRYEVDVTADGADRIDVSGKLTLGEQSVLAVRPAADARTNTDYVILSASGGIEGEFGEVASSLAFLTPLLAYGEDELFLRLHRNDVTFAGIADTPNRRRVARALDAVPPTGFGGFRELLDRLLLLSPEEARLALDQLAGTLHANGQHLARLFGGFAQATLDRLGLGRGGFDLSGLTLALADQPMAEAFAEDWMMRLDGAARQAHGLWARGYGRFGDIDADGNAPGADYTLGGLALGLDTRLGEHWTVGIAAGYGRSDVDSLCGELDIDSYQVAAYSGWRQGNWHAAGLVSHAWQDVDSVRAIRFPGFDALATADYDIRTFSAALEAGYDLALTERATLTPFASLAFARSHREGFTETGAAGLAVDGHTEHSLRPAFGLRLAQQWMADTGATIEPVLYAAYAREVLDSVSRVEARFAEAPVAAFLVDGPETDRDRFLAGAALSTRLTGRAALTLAWDADIADSDTAHTLSAMLRYRW